MAEMKKISVEDLKPGTIFNQAVYIDSENMLVEPHAALKEDDVKKLMKWGISEVETMGEIIYTPGVQENGSVMPASSNQVISEYEKLLSMRKKLIEVHSNSCEVVEKTYNSIRKDLSVDFSDLVNAVNSIINIMEENGNVFLFLNGLEDSGQNYLVTHSVNVTFYSILIAQAMNYDKQKQLELGMGTILIDSGMTKVPVYITHKQSNLTDSEYQMIKAHPVHGYKSLISYKDINEKIANISLQHHEQFDGLGYPRGLKGKEIDEYARIASISDSYEAQISNRTYREKVGAYHAMKNLLATGVKKFDPDILKVFLSRMSVYPIGSLVKLNDNALGLVIGSVKGKPLRPTIKLIHDENGNKYEETKIVNLVEDSSKFITGVLNEKEAGVDIFDVLWEF